MLSAADETATRHADVHTNPDVSAPNLCKHTFRRACTCARVCAVCSLALGDEGGGFQLIYALHLLLAWDIIVHVRKDRGVVCIFSILLIGVGGMMMIAFITVKGVW